MKTPFPYSTTQLPDGIIIGGPWPNTIITWPNGKCRNATKPEYDLFQALESARILINPPQLTELLAAAEEACLHVGACGEPVDMNRLRDAIVAYKHTLP